jgi:hypothetical protein
VTHVPFATRLLRLTFPRNDPGFADVIARCQQKRRAIP